MGCSLRLSLSCLFAFAAAAQVNVLTYKNDNARTGQNLNEPLLSPANVNAANFGRRFSHSVDGFIYGQPLYMASAPMDDGSVHNLVLVATGYNSIYAFDADDDLGANAAPLWKVSFINPDQGISPIPWDDVDCSVIYPAIGIVGTPVIDPATYTIYFVASTKEITGGNTRYVHRLHALDVRSGHEMPASPVEINASVPGTGDGTATVTFVPGSYKERSALLLANGVVYTSWSSHCDHGQYHGWIIGYRADTLEQVAVYNSTPNSSGASFWAAGAGPASDAGGNLFVVSANGFFDQRTSRPDLADSIIRLTPKSGLTIADYFTPYNQADLQNLDLDLGSSGALLLPPEAGNPAHRNLLVTAGKEGRIYLVDRDKLGGYNSTADAGALQTITLGGQGVFGSAAYFNGNIYISANGDRLRAFGVANAALTAAPVSSSPAPMGNAGPSPVVSANGSSNGIVWAYEFGATNQAVLHAFDATDLSTELYQDNVGSYSEFAAPTAADGKLYVDALDSLLVYGLLPIAPGGIGGVVNAASYQSKMAPGSLISIFGTNLARAATLAQQVPLPISLADTSVTVNGVRAPLLYVSQGQINAQLPPQTKVGPASLSVTCSGSATATYAFTVTPVAPAIFISTATRLLAFNQDTSVNSAENPAAAGSVVTVFVTGQGTMSWPAASIGGIAAKLTYAGPAPGSVGVGQLNMKVPALPPGDHKLVVNIGGVLSNSGLISTD